MPDPLAELSSVSTALDEMAARVATLAETAASAADETLANELYEIERALIGAQRRLAKLVAARPGR